jgi:TolA-binding protein
MEPWVIGELIPIVGIVSVACVIIAKMAFRFEERKLQIRGEIQNTGSDSVRSEVETLRQELARLRDTSTQYDISIQHTLEDVQQRLERVEAKGSVSSRTTPAGDANQESVITARSN